MVSNTQLLELFEVSDEPQKIAEGRDQHGGDGLALYRFPLGLGAVTKLGTELRESGPDHEGIVSRGCLSLNWIEPDWDLLETALENEEIQNPGACVEELADDYVYVSEDLFRSSTVGSDGVDRYFDGERVYASLPSDADVLRVSREITGLDDDALIRVFRNSIPELPDSLPGMENPIFMRDVSITPAESWEWRALEHVANGILVNKSELAKTKALLEEGYSQIEIAELLGKSRSTVSRQVASIDDWEQRVWWTVAELAKKELNR